MLISENIYRNCIIFKKIYAMEISVAQTYCNTFIWKKQVVFFIWGRKTLKIYGSVSSVYQLYTILQMDGKDHPFFTFYVPASFR